MQAPAGRPPPAAPNERSARCAGVVHALRPPGPLSHRHRAAAGCKGNSAWTSNSVCGGRGICGRCQIELAEGQFAKHGITSTAAHMTPLSEPERRFRGPPRLDQWTAAQLPRQAPRRCGDRRAAGQPGPSPSGCARPRRPATLRSDPVGAACAMWRSRRRRWIAPLRDRERLLAALADQWELPDLSCDLGLLPGLQALLRDGQWAGHGGGAG